MHTTLYIQNGRDLSKFNGCSPLQNCSGLISLKPASVNVLTLTGAHIRLLLFFITCQTLYV